MEYSGSKILRSLMRDLNLDIEEMRKSQEELLQTAQEMQDVERLSGVTGGGGGQSAAGAAGNGGTPAEGAGEGSAPAAEINQLAAARSGLTPNA
jgi:TolA-binding protein